jgi:hypothetical protein
VGKGKMKGAGAWQAGRFAGARGALVRGWSADDELRSEEQLLVARSGTAYDLRGTLRYIYL